VTAASITKESAARYNVDFNKHCKVEIGDAALAFFSPKVKFKKWGDECWISLSPQKAYTQKTPAELGDSKIDKVVVDSDDAKEAHHLYPLDESENHEQEEGLFELEAVVYEKPLSGGFTYAWNLEHSDNLAFFKQDILNAPLIGSVASRDEFGGYDAKGKQVEFWAPEALNSYAIYRKDLPAVMSEADGAKYKSGCVGRLRRPKVIDAKGAWEWADLDVDTEKKTVTVTGSAEFAKRAVLPVRIDPTFGYTTAGSFSTFGDDRIQGTYARPASPGRGIVTSLHAYIGSWSSGDKVKMALVTGADNNLKAPSTAERSDGHSGAQWATFTFSDPKPALQYLYYTNVIWSDSVIDVYYDFGSFGDSRDVSLTYGDWPRQLSLSDSPWLVSTYATFETSTIEKVRNVDWAYAYHFPGAKNIKVDGSFGATQGDAWVKIGDADQWSSVVTSDTCTINSWSASQIDITIPKSLANTLGNLWLYVKPNGGSANAYGFPVVIKKEWGQRYPDAESTTVNWCRAMGGTSPDVDNMTLESVSVYCGTSHGAQVRVAVYQGGTLTDPTGASLVEDFGVTAGSDTEAWQTLLSSSNPSLTKNAVTWIVVKGNDSSFGVAFSGDSGGGDFQTARGRYQSSSMNSIESSVFPANWPTDSGSFADFWYSFRLAYSTPPLSALQGQIDAKSVVAGSLSATTSLQGQIDATSVFTGALSATVPMFGQINGQSAITGAITEVRALQGQIAGQSALTGSLLKAIDLSGQIDAVSALTGSLFNSVPISGQIDAASALTGSLLKLKQISGQIDAQSDLWGCLCSAAALQGHVDARSIVAGSLSATVFLQGQIDAQSTIEGLLLKPVFLSGQIDADSALTGAVTVAAGLQGQIDAVSALAGSLSAVVPLQGQIDAVSALAGSLLKLIGIRGQIDAASALAGSLSAVVPLQGQIDAASALAGSLSAVVPLQGQIDAVSALAGSLSAVVPLQGQIDAVSALAGSVTVAAGLRGQIDAVSALAGSLSAVVPLQGQIDAQSAITGALEGTVLLQGQIDAQSVITGALAGAVVPLQGQIDAASALTGSLSTLVMLQGQIDAQGALAGSLSTLVMLQGQIDAQGALAGSLSAVVPLQGQIDAVSALAGSLSAVVPLQGQIDAVSALAGSLLKLILLSGQVDAQSALAGSLLILKTLAGHVDAQSVITGAMVATVPLQGQIDAVSALAGLLSSPVPLQGQIDAVSALAGLLDVTVPADLSVEAFDVVRRDGFFDMRRLDGLFETQRLDDYFEVKRGKND